MLDLLGYLCGCNLCLKHEVLSVFKHFKALVEHHFSTKLTVLKTDNGSKYTNSAFQAFCSSSGILHQTSCPHSPSQNGIFLINRLPSSVLNFKSP